MWETAGARGVAILCPKTEHRVGGDETYGRQLGHVEWLYYSQ